MRKTKPTFKVSDVVLLSKADEFFGKVTKVNLYPKGTLLYDFLIVSGREQF